MTTTSKPLRVAVIGHGFMGAVHSHAWGAVQRAFELESAPQLSVVCGRNAAALESVATRYGWRSTASDWREVVDRRDIDLVDICTPSDTHAQIAVAALEAGKHVLCEKPLANRLDDGEVMVAAAEKASQVGVCSMVAFNYRRVPALAFARQLIEAGQLGTIHHVRGVYLQDWLVDPDVPLTWRLDRRIAGSGALGDIGSHVIDLAQFLTGRQIAGVSARTRTFITRRPLSSAAAPRLAGGGSAAQSGPRTLGTGTVTVDDAAIIIGELEGGAMASFEATRMATGRKNALRIELNGSEGALAFDFESMNELSLFRRDDGNAAGFRRILVTEASHPYLEAWWPPGHGLGYDHTFINEIADFVRCIETGGQPEPSFADGLQIQRVLHAVESSASDNARWTAVDGLDTSTAVEVEA